MRYYYYYSLYNSLMRLSVGVLFFLPIIDLLFFTARSLRFITVDYLRKQYTWPASHSHARAHTCTKLQRAEIATQCTSVDARVSLKYRIRPPHQSTRGIVMCVRIYVNRAIKLCILK